MQKNVKKTIGMVCHHCQVAGVRADKPHTCRMTGEGRSYKERQQERVQHPECGKDLTSRLLVAHLQNHYGVAKRGSGQEGGKEGGVDEPRNFSMEFPAKARPRPFPV